MYGGTMGGYGGGMGGYGGTMGGYGGTMGMGGYGGTMGMGGMGMGGMNPMMMRQQRPLGIGMGVPGQYPTNALPGMQQQTGPVAAAPQMTPDERRMQNMHVRQQVFAQVFEVIGRILQLGAVLATSGHQILSIVIGTTFAVRTARSFLPASRSAGQYEGPNLIQGSEGFTRGSSFGSPDSISVVSSPTSARGAADAAASNVGWLRRVLVAIGRSPSMMIALIGLIVAVEHFVMKWRHQRHRDAIEAEERALGLSGPMPDEISESVNDVTAATNAMLQSADAQSVPLIKSQALSTLDTYVARHGFEAKQSNQLSLEPGDQVTITQFDPSGWCWAKVTNVRRGASLANREGFIPGNYVEKLVASQRRL